MNNSETEREERISRLHAKGVIDLHFDLLMDLYEKRQCKNVLTTQFLPDLEAGNMGVVGAAIYIEDRYLPEMALRVALDQIARLHTEVATSERFSVCRSYEEILQMRKAGKIALLITMEGAEPIGTDLDLLRAFFELGVRVLGLTHVRRNATGSGGVFAASGSSRDGLTRFGREVLQTCEELGIMIDLAHLNPAGFEDAFSCTTKPLIVSHSNARCYHDIERNLSDEQIKMIGERHGVIGINAVLVSPTQDKATLDCYIDHIEHVANLIGIEGVGIGFDFFEFIYQQWCEAEQQALAAKFARPNFIPGLTNHSHARNLTRKLIERGFEDEQIEKILFRNWMRMFAQLL